jgi:hypothetical protein
MDYDVGVVIASGVRLPLKDAAAAQNVSFVIVCA